MSAVCGGAEGGESCGYVSTFAAEQEQRAARRRNVTVTELPQPDPHPHLQ